MKQIYQHTPTYPSYFLKAQQGLHVHYKMECHQPSGSFKIRGMETFCRHFMAQGQTGFIASSGGNAGYSFAMVAQALGAGLEVVVPETTTEYMMAKIRALGATVTQHGAAWDEADAYCRAKVEAEGKVYVPPFDHELLWQGHASMIDECAGEMPEPDKVVLSVGGGGLLLGVLEGMARNGWHRAQVVAVETHGAASLHDSLAKGELVTLDRIDTIASSLGAKQVSAVALQRAQARGVKPHLVTDAQALAAVRQFLNEKNALVEPACGAALSYVYDNNGLRPEERMLVIACGGVSMGLEKLNSLAQAV